MEPPTIVVGVITKAHGVRGEVVVLNRSDNPERWAPGSTLFDADGSAFIVATARATGERIVVRFEGVDDRDAADALRGRELLVPRSWLPALPEGEWWPDELEGCRVVTDAGRDLGVLTEVVRHPANDLWVATDDAGVETFVPVVREFLIDVDVEARRIVVRELPGLTAPED
ncbi:MAG TPA: ribosome maturation factor RimM [Actinomycetota bacterium]|nr:ribosome maturation factor RimM [Actinomycetota bacterium]